MVTKLGTDAANTINGTAYADYLYAGVGCNPRELPG
jgi:hypothetical protein